jgi:hypothetical protein
VYRDNKCLTSGITLSLFTCYSLKAEYLTGLLFCVKTVRRLITMGATWSKDHSEHFYFWATVIIGIGTLVLNIISINSVHFFTLDYIKW